MFLAITITFFGFWMIAKENKALASKVRLLFFLSLGLLIIVSYFQSVSLITFIPKMIISFLLLAVAGGILSMMSENKIAQWLVLGMCTISTYHFQDKLNHFLPFQIKTEETTDYIPEYDPKGEILTQILPDSLKKLSLLLESQNIALRRAFLPLDDKMTDLDDYYLLDTPEGILVDEYIQYLKSKNYIIWAEANEKIAMEFPQKSNLKEHSTQTMTNDPSVKMQWHLQHLGMDLYYQYFKNRPLKPIKKSRLYILDTGIDSRHEDLDRPNGSNDKQGHGTHCAGVAAAITNNNIGVASMVPSSGWVSVHGLQVIGDVGFGTQEQIIDGIIRAADEGADVISMSLGGITNQAREKAYNDAVKYANDKGAIVIVAAGNANLDAKRYSPANTQNVITVTAINERNEKSGFSNHIQNLTMGIAAPGERILSTTPKNSYTSFNGTSMAAPQVAGLVSVMKAIKPSLSTQDAFYILNATGKATQNNARTGKLIQPLAAIKMLIEN